MADEGPGHDLGIAGLGPGVEIGRGGFAIVYRAMQHEPLERVVAVKVLSAGAVDEASQRAFRREARAMGLLADHPNIVTVLDAGVTDRGHPYLVMAFLPGGSLQDGVQRQERRDPQVVLDWGIKLAGALESAHRAGVIHRDVKPANVLLSGYGEILLGDFGIARVEQSTQRSVTGQAFTLAHAPPELFEGHRADERSDVYSLTSTLYTLLAGRSPFERDDDSGQFALLRRIGFDAPPDLRPIGVPPPLWEVLEAGMSKDPAGRPPSAEDLGRRLQRVQQALGLPVTTIPLASVVAEHQHGDETLVASLVTPEPHHGAIPLPQTPPQTPQHTPPETPWHDAPVAVHAPAGGRPPGPHGRRRSVLVGVAVAAVLLAGVGGVLALALGSDDEPSAGRTVAQGAGEGAPAASPSTGGGTGSGTGDATGGTGVSEAGGDDPWMAAPWVVTTGGDGAASVAGMAAGPGGQVILVGAVEGTTTFGDQTVVGPRPQSTTYVARIDDDGTLRHVAEASSDDGELVSRDVAVDRSGDAYVVGSYSGTAVLGPHTLSSPGEVDVFVARLDGDGAWSWAVGGGGSAGPGQIHGVGIAVGEDGTVFVTGSYSGVVRLGERRLTRAVEDGVFVAALDPSGTWLWATTTQGGGSANAVGIDLDGDGRPYVTGTFEGASTFGDTRLSTTAEEDLFVARLGTDGRWEWATAAGATGRATPDTMATDAEGRSYVVGIITGSTPFGDHAVDPVDGPSMVVAAIDDRGSWLWATVTGAARGRGVAVGDQDVVVAGYVTGGATFGTQRLDAEAGDAPFLASIAEDGSWLSASGPVGAGGGAATAVVRLDDGTAVLAGEFAGSLSMAGGRQAATGPNDLFVTRLDDTG